MRFKEAQSRMRRADELRRAARVLRREAATMTVGDEYLAAHRSEIREAAIVSRAVAQGLVASVPPKLRGVWR